MIGLSACVSLSLSLSVCVFASISLELLAQSSQTCVQIPCGCGSVLLWRRCATSCTFGFIDDVTFGCDTAVESDVDEYLLSPHADRHLGDISVTVFFVCFFVRRILQLSSVIRHLHTATNWTHGSRVVFRLLGS